MIAENRTQDCRRLWETRTGVGIDLSRLRDPVEALVGLSQLNLDTPLLEGEAARPRRGNMATLDVTHPRVRDFVALKRNAPGTIPNFNVSLRVSDKWMAAHADSSSGESWLLFSSISLVHNMHVMPDSAWPGLQDCCGTLRRRRARAGTLDSFSSTVCSLLRGCRAAR